MKITACQYCGILSDWDTCVQLYGKKEDYYGEFTKCPFCQNCLYKEPTDKVAIKFDKEK